MFILAFPAFAEASAGTPGAAEGDKGNTTEPSQRTSAPSSRPFSTGSGSGSGAGRPCSAASNIRHAAPQHPADTERQYGDRPVPVLAGVAAVMPAAVADRIAVAQQEHGQPLVKMATLPDLLPIVEDRHRHPVDRAGHGGIVQPLDHHILRRPPGEAEGLRVGPLPQGIGGLAAHPDGAAGLIDAAAGGQGLDEFELLVRRPAVVAVAEQDGPEDGVASSSPGAGSAGIVLGGRGGG